MNDLLRRQAALKATLTRWQRLKHNWKTGRHCVALARDHAVAMGHAPPRLPKIRSLLAARRALKEHGWADTCAMLGALFPEIPVAAALPGDLVVVMETGDGIGAVLIAIEPHKFAGWREDAPRLVVLDLDWSDVTKAYRL